MFSRKEEPYLNIVLARLTTIHTLIKTQAQHSATPNHSFNLKALASMLDITQKSLPRLFSILSNYEKQKFSRWFSVQYDLIRFDEDSLSMYFHDTNDRRFSARTVDAFYAFQNRVRDYYIQSPHAVIFFQNNLYHYDCSNEPHSLTQISKPGAHSDYEFLKTKLTQLPRNIIQPANPKERIWIASFISVKAEIKNRPIDVFLVEKFLTQVQNAAEKQREEWQNVKNEFLFYSLLGGGGAFAALALQGTIVIVLKYLLTGVIIPASIIIGLNIPLLCAGLIVLGGFGFALYAYMQERFCNRLSNALSQVETTPAGERSITPFNFFQNHRPILDSAFTEENYLRAGITP